MVHAAVFDTSPLVLYATIGRSDLLRAAAARIVVPTAVLAEAQARDGAHGAATLARSATWVNVIDVGRTATAVMRSTLGAGESAVLTHVLAEPIGREAVLDDRDARKFAARAGLRVVGSVGLAVRARRLGLVPAARPIVAALVAAGLHIDPAIVERTLAAIGE